ncbi:MAG: DNA mismatch repair endonuclease MutL [Treponema sp.]|nr:DNA mismatch repair endonuclease MutL [Treponema sp.]
MEARLRRPVRKLSVDVARKIAAGEVIDRPGAIVRELMDNAVDSGADSITVEISGGGIEKVRVSDNGSGMTEDDLKNCAQPHATSKIIDADDLMHLTTLGFRGEALASIAAVSRLSIMSGNAKMTARVGDAHKIQTIAPVQNGVGTIVQSENLFEDFPARRKFLKRPASETMFCRETFVEKALPRTDISFRLIIDSSVRYDLPKNQTLAERFVKSLEMKDSATLFSEIKNEGFEADGKTKWSFTLVIGSPSVYRNDRKQIFIYVNGRKVQEFSLVQAIEYGCQGFFPNGVHPVAALFVQVDPSLVDFNIHPAKKEVRFKDIASVHHGVSSATKNFFRSYGIKSTLEEEKKNESESKEISVQKELFSISTPVQKVAERAETFSSHIPNSTVSFHKNDFSSISARLKNYDSEKSQSASYDISHTTKTLAEKALGLEKISTPAERKISDSTEEKKSVRFIGTALGTFLLAEADGELYFIDQHAAHERFLFDKLMATKGTKQNLLLPVVIETDSDEDDAYIESQLSELEAVGFTGKKVRDGRFEFSTIPARWNGSEENLRELLLDERLSPKDLVYKIAAMTACKAAVKDGTLLDRQRAEELVHEALALPDPHCPHGRPVWTIFTKENLFARVRRTMMKDS